jgi:hypothetical protein
VALVVILSVPAQMYGADTLPETKQVVPDSNLSASGSHRLFFGSGYRDLWTTPIEIGFLDLRTFAGGLTPTGTGGGMQSLGLRFKGADGRPYSFRPMKKSLLSLLPPELHGTFVEDLVQDQVKSAMPTAPPVVPVLLDAVGVLHASPRIVVIPDDTLLGEYRDHFAYTLGTIEEWPNEGEGGTPGFAGATEVVSTDELFEILRSDPSERVDTTNYLTARLIDLLIGDWDRHRGQWRWANVGAGTPPSWKPIPEDRDQAFVKYDGLMLTLGRVMAPQLTNFSDKYGSMLGMTWNGRDVDRRLLVGLEDTVWDSVARFVQSRITDEVIEQALLQLPESHYDLRGSELASDLRQRRDNLPLITREYYLHLAGEVDIRTTDLAETVEAVRLPDGSLEVTIGSVDPDSTAPGMNYRRRFDPDDTDDLRLYLYGGDDRINVRGDGPDRITMRVLCGEGSDLVIDTSAGRASRVYDTLGVDGVEAVGLKVDRRPYAAPKTLGFSLPPRDWGTRELWTAMFDIDGDIGLLIGLGRVKEYYGFRKKPYATRLRTKAGYSTGMSTAKVIVGIDRRPENSKAFHSIDLMFSGIESTNFFGYGNESPFPDDEELGDIDRSVFRVTPAWGSDLTPRWTLLLGLPLEYSDTEDNPETVVAEDSTYGSHEFWSAGFKSGLEYDSRDLPGWPRTGVNMVLGGSYFPEWLDVEKGSFGAVDGRVSVFVPLSSRIVAAGRVGGRKVWGDFPYWEAAFIGGNETVRGYAHQRFAGDASVYGSLELRTPITKLFALLPWEFGLYLLADGGRVFLPGESSDKWHSGYGFGIWGAPVLRQYTMSLAVAKSEEDTRVYFTFGLGH